MCIVNFRHEAELNSELSWSRWILNSLIYAYSDKFISHVASKHAVWHLYFCDNTRICVEDLWSCKKNDENRVFPISKGRAVKKCSVTVAASKALFCWSSNQDN